MPPTEIKIYEVFAQYNIDSEQLIKLFFQSALLDASLSQKFPLIFLKDPMESLLDNLVKFINKSKDIRPSTISQIMTTLLTKVEEALNDLLSQIEQPEGIFRDELAFAQREDFVIACQGFLAKLRSHFQETQVVFSTLGDDISLNEEFIDTCFKYLYTEYEYGRQWAMRFFEYSYLNYAQVNVEAKTSENACGIKMQTFSNDRRRYIKLEISSHLCIEDFFKLPLYTFHEYISHLCASTYRRFEESAIQMNEVVKSYQNVPDQLDEGWMVQAAHEFLSNKMYELVSVDHQHWEALLKGTVDYWITNMHYPYGGNSHTTLGQSGSSIATDFLRFLKRDVCEGDEKRAYELYYRISIDLIMHYPYADFKHLDFMIAIEKLCKINKNQSIEVIRNSLDEGGTYINIERLWEFLKKLPKHSSKLSFRL